MFSIFLILSSYLAFIGLNFTYILNNQYYFQKNGIFLKKYKKNISWSDIDDIEFIEFFDKNFILFKINKNYKLIIDLNDKELLLRWLYKNNQKNNSLYRILDKEYFIVQYYTKAKDIILRILWLSFFTYFFIIDSVFLAPIILVISVKFLINMIKSNYLLITEEFIIEYNMQLFSFIKLNRNKEDIFISIDNIKNRINVKFYSKISNTIFSFMANKELKDFILLHYMKD
jgi:hypothetical protein